MKTILIITNTFDIHADFFISLLEQNEVKYFRLNLDKFPCEYKINQSLGMGSIQTQILNTTTKASLFLEDVGAAWNRKPAPYSFMSKELSAQELAYANTETEHALLGLLYSLDCYWVSHPVHMRGAMWKFEQLKRAKDCGFQIPKTLITNEPATVIKFKESLSSKMIFKSLSTADLASSEVSEEELLSTGLPTTIVEEGMLEDLNAVKEMPCHFQEYIPKQYELRVTVVGDKLFAAKIHSQEDERTAIDSRDMSAEILYEAVELPRSIHKLCLKYVKSYNLNYSAMDIIVTPDNEYVFLENNPNGQFMYIQQLIPEFALFETLMDNLIEGASCS